MRISTFFSKKITLAFCIVNAVAFSQVPLANFSLSPNPVCQGNLLQIIDLSTNAPTAWSYTVRTQGPNPGGPIILTTQNPTVILNAASVYTITLIATNLNGKSIPVSQTIQVIPGPTGQVTPTLQNTCIGGSPVSISIFNVGPGGASYSYSWSTGSTSTGILVSPTITTIYSCIITSSNGCTTSRNSTVTIAQPTVALSSVPFSICPGGSSTLTATGQGGGTFTYLWSTSATTRTISTNVPGVYDVTVTNSGGCVGTQSYILGTSTTLSLSATANPSILCQGNIATLRVVGGTTYSWSSGGTTPNTTVSPVTSTNYTVIGAAGTCTGLATVLLSVSISPTVIVTSTPPSLCSGQTATLSASGASTYSWIPLGAATSSVLVSPTVNTTYTVRGTNPGCPPKISTITVNVLTAPVINVSSSASVVCAFENVALAASGASTYVWNTGSTGAVIIVSPSVTSVFTVVGTAANTCTVSLSVTQSVSACDGITGNTFSVSKMKIYPNPTSGNFSVESQVDLDVRILNEIGAVVRILRLSAENEYKVMVGDLSAGLYMLEGVSARKVEMEKIIVLHE